jgi:hypothetical protein
VLDADYDVAAKRGGIRRLGEALAQQARGAILDGAVEGLAKEVPVEELFERTVTNRRTSLSTDVAEFLAGIRPQTPVTGFDASLSAYAGHEDLRRVLDPPVTWGLAGDEVGRAAVDRNARQTFRVAWRLDVSEATSVSGLRRPVDVTMNEEVAESVPDF